MLTVTVDRLVYHACLGVRVCGNDLYLFFRNYYFEMKWSDVRVFEIEVVPDWRQLDRIDVGEESVDTSCGIGLLAF